MLLGNRQQQKQNDFVTKGESPTKYWALRSTALRQAGAGQARWQEAVADVAVQFEPGYGFVAVLLCPTGVNPEGALEAGYEVQHKWRPALPEETLTPEKATLQQALDQAAANIPNRPKGGVTALIWQCADQMHREKALTRADGKRFKQLCYEATGANMTTIGVQWSKWCRAHGIV